MKRALCSASGVAILASLFALPAAAQEAGNSQAVQVTQEAGPQQAAAPAAPDKTPAPQDPSDQSPERVVVTGSLFAGTPEDSALPVQVFSQQELEKQGAPTLLEFARDLTGSGVTRGEGNPLTGGAGNVGFNLRGIGADKTLILLNGRRVNRNANLIPNVALARTELLKDGAAVIYGADATGGVVNFITRTDFTGLETSVQYKGIKDTKGDYQASILGGFGIGEANFMWAIEYAHRSKLNSEDRDFVIIDRDINPFSWSTLSDTATYVAHTTRPTSPTGNTAVGEFGPALAGTYADFTQQSCTAIKGYYTANAAGVPTNCAVTYMPYLNLLDDQDVTRAYAQFTSPLTNNVKFNADITFDDLNNPFNLSPGPAMVRGPARASGASEQLYVPRDNPGFMDFAVRSGLASSPNFGSVQGVSPTTYRVYGHDGSPFWGPGDSINIKGLSYNWRVSSGLKGSLADVSEKLSDINFDFGLTYNQQISRSSSWDVVGWKLQEAIDGFGGPDCHAVDLNPYQLGTQNPAAAGKNGCQYFNPFASAIIGERQLGLANPTYVPALANNSKALHDWMVDPWSTESVGSDLTVDLNFSGATPLKLPGGNVDLAVGTQWRTQGFRQSYLGNTYASGSLLCEWPSNFTTGVNAGPGGTTIPVSQTPRTTTDPLFAGCTPDQTGPGVFRTVNVPANTSLQDTSFFASARLPVLDNLEMELAVRREDFSNGLGATIYKASGKWNVWGPLSLRASYGTNYQAPPASLIPGQVNNTNIAVTRSAGNWKTQTTVTRSDITPETAKVGNVGAIWQSQGFASDHSVRVILDYFDIQTQDSIGQLANINDIANNVFSGAAVPGQTGIFYANCASPFIGRVQFNDVATAPGGRCTQGQTTSDDFALIRTELGNGPGTHVAGFDLEAYYTLPVGPGDLRLSADATYLTKDLLSAKILDGVTITPAADQLGFLNKTGNDTAQVPELRAHVSAGYSLGKHNFNLGVNYVSAVTDQRAGIQYGENGEEWITATATWTYELFDDLRLRLTIDNIFDRDPPPVGQELSYDPTVANPFGRTIEIGIKKTF